MPAALDALIDGARRSHSDALMILRAAVVVPGAGVVAVRLIDAGHPPAGAAHSGWPEIRERILELAAEYCGA